MRRLVRDDILERAAELGAPRRPVAGGLLARPDLGMAGREVLVPLTTLSETIRPLLKLAGDDPLARSLHIVATSRLFGNVLAPGPGVDQGSPPPPTPADFVRDSALLIDFGTGGAQHRVEVDLGSKGTHLVVPCGQVTVSVQASGSGTLRVRGTAAYSNSRNPWPPTRTLRNADTAPIAPGGAVVFAIPELATAVRIQRDPSSEAYEWAFRRNNLVVFATGVVGAGVGEELVRVPPEAETLVLSNLGAANIDLIRAIFEVYL